MQPPTVVGVSNPTRSPFTGLLVCAISAVGIPVDSIVAYEQGSMFLFDIREGEEAAAAGRIAISPSAFTEDNEKPSAELASESERSEFEVEFNAFGTESGNGFENEFDVGSFESSSSSGESSFGSGAPKSTGFNFSY